MTKGSTTSDYDNKDGPSARGLTGDKTTEKTTPTKCNTTLTSSKEQSVSTKASEHIQQKTTTTSNEAKKVLIETAVEGCASVHMDSATKQSFNLDDDNSTKKENNNLEKVQQNQKKSQLLLPLNFNASGSNSSSISNMDCANDSSNSLRRCRSDSSICNLDQEQRQHDLSHRHHNYLNNNKIRNANHGKLNGVFGLPEKFYQNNKNGRSQSRKKSQAERGLDEMKKLEKIIMTENLIENPGVATTANNIQSFDNNEGDIARSAGNVDSKTVTTNNNQLECDNNATAASENNKGNNANNSINDAGSAVSNAAAVRYSRIFKKSSQDGNLILFLPHREIMIVENKVEPLMGVALVHENILKVPNIRVFLQVVLIFRYGREDEELMGLRFCNEIVIAAEQIYPLNSSSSEDTNKESKTNHKDSTAAVPNGGAHTSSNKSKKDSTSESPPPTSKKERTPSISKKKNSKEMKLANLDEIAKAPPSPLKNADPSGGNPDAISSSAAIEEEPKSKNFERSNSQQQIPKVNSQGFMAVPFVIDMGVTAPPSVRLLPCRPYGGSPIGTTYEVQLFASRSPDELPRKRKMVQMSLRLFERIPKQLPPKAIISFEKSFIFSDNNLIVNASLNDGVYSEIDEILLNLDIKRVGGHGVKKIKVGIVQQVSVAMFSTGNFKNHVGYKSFVIDPTDSSYETTIPLKMDLTKDYSWVAMDETAKKDADIKFLAPTVAHASRSVFIIRVQYYVNVHLYLGLLHRGVVIKLPFLLKRLPQETQESLQSSMTGPVAMAAEHAAAKASSKPASLKKNKDRKNSRPLSVGPHHKNRETSHSDLTSAESSTAKGQNNAKLEKTNSRLKVNSKSNSRKNSREDGQSEEPGGTTNISVSVSVENYIGRKRSKEEKKTHKNTSEVQQSTVGETDKKNELEVRS